MECLRSREEVRPELGDNMGEWGLKCWVEIEMLGSLQQYLILVYRHTTRHSYVFSHGRRRQGLPLPGADDA